MQANIVRRADNIPSYVKFEVNNISEQFPDEWARLYEAWGRYAQYLQDEIDKSNGAHIPDHLPSRIRPPAPGEITLSLNDAGLPIMPEITETTPGHRCLALMRAYINAQYSKCLQTISYMALIERPGSCCQEWSVLKGSVGSTCQQASRYAQARFVASGI